MITQSEVPPTTHNVDDCLTDITTDQQKLLTAIKLHHIEDFSSSEDRNWTPIACAREKLQLTKNITGPATFEASKNITIRTIIALQQEDSDQQIHQFLGVLSYPTRYSFKNVSENLYIRKLATKDAEN